MLKSLMMVAIAAITPGRFSRNNTQVVARAYLLEWECATRCVVWPWRNADGACTGTLGDINDVSNNCAGCWTRASTSTVQQNTSTRSPST